MQSRSFNSFFLFLSYIRKKVRMCEKITKNSKIKKGISGRNSNLLNLKKISKPVPLVSRWALRKRRRRGSQSTGLKIGFLFFLVKVITNMRLFRELR
nr:MAG: hypothetical protein [Trichoderma atroviride partitivirus 1]